MGLTTFSLFCLFRSFTVEDEVRSVFSLDTFDDRRFVLASGMSLAAIVLATEFGPFQRLLQTVDLDLGEWLVCIAVAASIIVVTEVYKAVQRRRLTAAPLPAAPTTRDPVAAGARA
jgi:Ca2+-transporting ATPase